MKLTMINAGVIIGDLRQAYKQRRLLKVIAIVFLNRCICFLRHAWTIKGYYDRANIWFGKWTGRKLESVECAVNAAQGLNRGLVFCLFCLPLLFLLGCIWFSKLGWCFRCAYENAIVWIVQRISMRMDKINSSLSAQTGNLSVQVADCEQKGSYPHAKRGEEALKEPSEVV
jgi:hypothetical protein